MCVALPARVVWVGGQAGGSIPGRVLVGDTETEVELMMIPDVSVGDHVVMHSGYAISVVPEAAAAATRRLLADRDDQ